MFQHFNLKNVSELLIKLTISFNQESACHQKAANTVFTLHVCGSNLFFTCMVHDAVMCIMITNICVAAEMSEFLHEAGFDSFACGCVFLRLAHIVATRNR